MKSLLMLLLIVSFTNVFAQSNTIVSETIIDPTAMVSGSFGGNVQAVKFKAAKKIEVKSIDTSAAITSFTIYFQGKGFETAPGILENVKGNLFTKEVLRFLERCKPGTTVKIDDIKVVSGNVIKKVPSLYFILQ